MGYANSVGDFGGLTSYDAHFFFFIIFFLLFAILSPTLINSLDYSKAFSYNQHKEAKKPISVDIAKVKLLRRASFFILILDISTATAYLQRILFCRT